MGHVVKAKERAEVKRYGGRLHQVSFNRSLQQVLSTLMSLIFCLSCPDARFLLLFLLCFIRYFLFFSSFFFLRLGEGRPLPPLRTTTLIQTRAPQQLHTQELGFLPYATSYHLQRLCKTEKKTGRSGAGHEGERCAESWRDPGRWKEKGGSDHLAHRASHPDTLRSEKSHRFLKVPVTIFFLLLSQKWLSFT